MKTEQEIRAAVAAYFWALVESGGKYPIGPTTFTAMGGVLAALSWVLGEDVVTGVENPVPIDLEEIALARMGPQRN